MDSRMKVMTVPELNVEQLMQNIREEVAGRRHRRAAPAHLAPIRLFLPRPATAAAHSLFPAGQGNSYRLRDFIRYEGTDFIHAAYRGVLNREPDPDGLNCYLEMLRQGATKAEILGRIRNSREGRQEGKKIYGLRLAYVFDSICRWPVIGRIVGIVIAMWRIPATERGYRMLSTELAYEQAHRELNSAQATRYIHEALQTLVANLNDAIVTIGQNKTSIDDLAELRTAIAQLSAAVETATGAADASLRQTEELNGKIESLAQLKADRTTTDVFKAEILGALARLETNFDGRFDDLAAAKADHAFVERAKAEAMIAIDAIQRSATEALKSAIASVDLRAQDLRRHVLDQDRRVGLLLEEARKRFPDTISKRQIRAILSEGDHRLDAMYATFEDQFRGTRADIRQRQAVYLPYVRNARAGTADAPVIDIGCGRGEWLELLRDEGLVARGVDLNRIFLDECRERNLDVVEQDALTFLRQLKRDSVGVVTCFHMIEHLDQSALIALLDETLRVLHPGGVAIFETPNPRNLMVGSCNFYMDPTHKRPLPPDLSRYLLEARGLNKVEVLELHPYGPEHLIKEGDPALRDALNRILYSSQDYAVIGWKS
jgi:SAM-dependent methyltransferase